MQMDSNSYSYYYNAGVVHDEIPCFYPNGAAPESPELPPFVEPTTTASAFRGYGGDGPPAGTEVVTAGAGQNNNVHRRVIDALGRMEVDRRDQCQATRTDQDEEEELGRPDPGAAAAESSRGFRHMMRERQRREKLSQSYAELYAMVAARSKGDKNSIVQSAATYIQDLKGAREQLRRRNEELKARILGHDARQPSVKVDFEVDDPVSGIDSMVGALRRLKSMGVKATGIRSTMSGGRLWTEMNIETTVAACEVEKAVEEALMKEVERNQPPPQADDSGSAAAPFPFPGSSSAKGWGPQAATTHVQNVF